MPPETAIRRMEIEDADSVHALDVLCFSLPWPRRSWDFEMLSNPASRPWVLLLDGRIIGFAVLWRVEDEATLGTFAVHPDFRRLGLGRRLLGAALDAIRAEGVANVYLDVRRSNLAAQKLYADFGFTVTGERKRYYSDNAEDALEMCLELNLQRNEEE